MPAGYQVLLPEYVEGWTMDADGFSIVDNRAGVTFELYVPWDAPEMAVDFSSGCAAPLRNVPDVRGYAQGGESAIQKETAGADHVSFAAP